MVFSLVDTSEDDSTLVLAKFIGNIVGGQDGARFASTVESQLASESFDALVKGMVDRLPSWLGKADEKDAEGGLAILCHNVAKLEAGPQVAHAASLARAIAANSPSEQVTLKGLTELFNCCAPGTGRLAAILELARVASAPSSTIIDVVCTMLAGKVAGWISAWRLSPGEARSLQLAVASALTSASQRTAARDTEALQYFTQGLASLEGEQEAVLAKHRPEAHRALLVFLRSEGVYYCDLLGLKAVNQLSKDAKTADVLSLTQMLVTGDARGVETLLKSKPAVAAEVGVSAEAAVDRARLMALLAVCAPGAAGGVPVPYEALSKAMGVPLDAVEPWVARAVASRLLEARLDQVNDSVVVRRCTQRVFGDAQWKELRARLQQVRASVDAIAGVQAAAIKV